MNSYMSLTQPRTPTFLLVYFFGPTCTIPTYVYANEIRDLINVRILVLLW